MDPEKNVELKIPIVSLFDFVKIPENCSLEHRLQIQDVAIFAERKFSGISVEDEMKLTDGFVSIFGDDEKIPSEPGFEPHGGAAEGNKVEVDVNRNVDDCVSDSDSQVVRKYACQICGKEFDQKSSRKNHQVTHNHSGDFKCETCHKNFARKSDLDKHLKRCVEMVKLRLQLTERDADQAPYRCDRCPERFWQERLLDEHRSANGKCKQFQCQVCHKAFSDKSNLRKHATLHTGEKPFSCSECGARFRLRQNWQQHEMRHRKDFMLDCDFCGKLFVAKTSLQEHLMTHMKPQNAAAESDLERAFRCALCGKRFATKKKLQRHAVTHSDKKRYECAACGKAFHDKSNLNKHELIHTGEKLFKCGCCTKAFRLKHQRDRHWESFHREQEAGLKQDKRD